MESSPSQSQKELHRYVDQVFQNCLSTAKNFATSTNTSNVQDCAKELLSSMATCNSLKINSIKHLKSHEIVSLILEGIRGGSDNQIDVTNKDEYCLSQILQLNTIWSLQYTTCPDTLDVCLDHKCSKGLTASLVQKCVDECNNRRLRPRVQINIVTFPSQQYTQKNHWFDFKFLKEEEEEMVTINVQLNVDQTLRHATCTQTAIEILQKNLDKDSICLTGKSRVGCLTSFVWCGLDLPGEIMEKIPEKPKNHVLENRYGGVIFKFPVDATRIRKDKRAFILGTREYWKEFSQAILIPKRKSPAKFYGYNTGNEVHELELVADVQNYDWKLSYGSESGTWTHPEVIFAENLKILKNKLRIYFVDHSCMSGRDCADCNIGIQIKERTKEKFDELLKANPDMHGKLIWRNDSENSTGYYTFL